MQEFLQPLLPEEERHYLILSRQGDMNARNLLVEHNLRLVAHIVKKYHNLDRGKRRYDLDRCDRADQSDQYV